MPNHLATPSIVERNVAFWDQKGTDILNRERMLLKIHFKDILLPTEKGIVRPRCTLLVV